MLICSRSNHRDCNVKQFLQVYRDKLSSQIKTEQSSNCSLILHTWNTASSYFSFYSHCERALWRRFAILLNSLWRSALACSLLLSLPAFEAYRWHASMRTFACKEWHDLRRPTSIQLFSCIMSFNAHSVLLAPKVCSSSLKDSLAKHVLKYRHLVSWIFTTSCSKCPSSSMCGLFDK